MQINITEIKEKIVEGVIQKQFNVTYVSDEGEQGSQLMVLSGDALADPEAAFLDGYNRTPNPPALTEPQTDLSTLVQQQQALIENLTTRLNALEGN
jgi:hypothetical protein